MDKPSPVELLNNSNKLLSDNNDLLIKSHAKTTALLEEINKKQEKILTYFDKVYRFIEAKNDKNRAASEITEELYDLITNVKAEGSEKQENTPRSVSITLQLKTT